MSRVPHDGRALFPAARRGEHWAQEEITLLLRAYARHVCRGGSLGGERGLTWEDLAQEAGRKFFTRGLALFRPGGPERAYLYAIVRTTYLQLSRSAIRRREREAGGTAIGSPGTNPESRTQLHSILQRLSAECRELLARLYFDGATYAQLSLDLDLAESSVRARASRCLSKAREIVT